MQAPIFRYYNIDESVFWQEVQALPDWYNQSGIRVSKETVYLNHILTYIKYGLFPGLNNKLLKDLGAELNFYEGLPSFFKYLKDIIEQNTVYKKHGIILEHYIISTGLAEIIRGSLIAPYVEAVFGCELLESPLPPGFMNQTELSMQINTELTQIGMIVDNTIKTRFIFEINKGTNKHPEIEVNASIAYEDRRIPFENMLYIADGPSDIPTFSVIQSNGGKTYAVYEPGNKEELKQNDQLRTNKRVDHYGPADYSLTSSTAQWIEMQILNMCDTIVFDRQKLITEKVGKAPKHIHLKNKPIQHVTHEQQIPLLYS